MTAEEFLEGCERKSKGHGVRVELGLWAMVYNGYGLLPDGTPVVKATAVRGTRTIVAVRQNGKRQKWNAANSPIPAWWLVEPEPEDIAYLQMYL